VEDETKAHEQGAHADVMGGRSAQPGRRQDQRDVMGGRSAQPGRRQDQRDVMGGRTAEERQRVATESSAPPSFRPSLWQRVETWWKRDRLDEQLARGADPNAAAELRLRAAQLVSTAGRVELADALETVVREARGRHAAVQACADDLLALARRLRDEGPVDVRGAAMTRRLVADLAGSRPVGRVPFRPTTVPYGPVGRVPYRATSPRNSGDTESLLHEAVRSAQLALGSVRPEDGSFSSAA
jgi:hypothetical protein